MCNTVNQMWTVCFMRICSTSIEWAVFQCGPGHIRVHTAEIMWSHVTQTISKCGWITVRPQCVSGSFTLVFRAVHLWLYHPGRTLIPSVNKAVDCIESHMQLLHLLLSYIRVTNISWSTSRWAGRLWSLGALSWAGVWVSFQSQTERGHGGGHLRQVVGAQVSSEGYHRKFKENGTLSFTKTCVETFPHMHPH